MAGQEWGADRGVLQTACSNGKICARLWKYGIWIGGTAGEDRIQAQALRICCGAYPTTPTAAMEVEVNEISCFQMICGDG